MTTLPYSVYRYVKTTLARYAPPYAPPALDIGTVAEAEADHGGGTQSRNSIWEKVGPWDRKPDTKNADISTLLREMRQLCV